MNHEPFDESPSQPSQVGWKLELEIEALHCAAELCGNSSDVSSSGSQPQAEALSMSSVWQMESLAAADAALNTAGESYAYRRIEHPNARALAVKLAQLHAAERTVVTAQGMSSLAAVALANLQPGARVWLSQELYGETSQLFENSLCRWQVETEVFDPSSAAQVRKLADSSVDMVVVETMTNPRLIVCDIPRIAQATKEAGGLLVVDNTFATHLLCQPLLLGANFVIESLGKQVNGHSDGMAGFVGGRDSKRMLEVANVVKTFGLTSSPLDCYLTHRGLMSLAVRMERACANAMALAQLLTRLPIVREVDYPGLPQHADHNIARQQFTGGFGWMVTFRVDMDRPGVELLLSALRPEIRFVPSLGDVCTTVSHPLSTSHRDSSPQLLAALGITTGTLRVSCGIEPTEWLLACFRKALL
ncbi:MAG: PLP-dependent transferase [Planctomycetales bacterium]|nr:PLP-dependent transferase [Planctomycetales bacterium]